MAMEEAGPNPSLHVRRLQALHNVFTKVRSQDGKIPPPAYCVGLYPLIEGKSLTFEELAPKVMEYCYAMEN